MLQEDWKALSGQLPRWRGTELRWQMLPLRSSWRSRLLSGSMVPSCKPSMTSDSAPSSTSHAESRKSSSSKVNIDLSRSISACSDAKFSLCSSLEISVSAAAVYLPEIACNLNKCTSPDNNLLHQAALSVTACTAGWKSTVQGLIDRFEDLNLSPPTPPAAEGDAVTDSDATSLDESAAAHHKALTAATRTVSGQDAQLAKLRAHFHKVRRIEASSLLHIQNGLPSICQAIAALV